MSGKDAVYGRFRYSDLKEAAFGSCRLWGLKGPDGGASIGKATVWGYAGQLDRCATDIGGHTNKIVETLLRRSIQYPIIPEDSRPRGFVPWQRRLHTAPYNAD
jgi:hypothetical protein